MKGRVTWLVLKYVGPLLSYVRYGLVISVIAFAASVTTWLDGGSVTALQRRGKVAAVASMMFFEKSKAFTIATACLGVITIGHWLLTLRFPEIEESWLPAYALMLGYLAVLLLDIIFVGYRTRKGAFGDNESEARELVRFILKNRDKIDRDGDGSIRIFDPAEKSEFIQALADYAHGSRHA